MNVLPTTYQAMKDYIRWSEKEILNCNKKIEVLKQHIIILKDKVKKIEEQEGIVPTIQ